jgi:hypothetical protein
MTAGKRLRRNTGRGKRQDAPESEDQNQDPRSDEEATENPSAGSSAYLDLPEAVRQPFAINAYFIDQDCKYTACIAS